MINNLWNQMGNLVDKHSTRIQRVSPRRDGDILQVFVGTMSKSGAWENVLDKQYPYTESGLKDAIMDMTNVLEG